MIEITNILPQCGKLNETYKIALNRDQLLYEEQCFISDFYSNFCDTEKFETMIINVIHELEIEKSSVILKSLQTEIDNNILLYDKNQSFWKNVDTGNICRTYTKKDQHLIEEQYKIHKEYDHNLKLANRALEAVAIRHCPEHERDELWREYNYQKSLHDRENEKLYILQKAQVELEKETLKYINNKFEKIFELNNYFLSVLNKYIHVKEETKKQSTATTINKGITYFKLELISEIYQTCNDVQFNNISELDFINNINLRSSSLSFQIKTGEIERVCYLINRLSKKCTKENKIQWLENIKKHLGINENTFKSKRTHCSADKTNPTNVDFVKKTDNLFKAS